MFQGDTRIMSERITVGELVAAFLERCSAGTAFGVISIHNMPILDAFGRRAAQAAGRGEPPPIRFVGARSEAGAVNMADGYARVSGGIGVAITSTGTAAGNAGWCDGGGAHRGHAGAASDRTDRSLLTSIVILLTSTKRPEQLDNARAVSKAAFRIRSPETAIGTLREAVRVALTRTTRPGQRRNPDRHPGRAH